jgi:hypothetical protein
MAPKSGVFEAPPGGGIVYEYTNDTDKSFQPEYAEFTAPRVCFCRATIDGHQVVKAWAGGGGAHSWWVAAGGRFFRYPLKPKQTLKIELSDEGAIRIDWYE